MTPPLFCFCASRSDNGREMGRQAYAGSQGLAASGRPRFRRILPRVAALATALILLGAKLSLYAAHTIRAELLVASVAGGGGCTAARETFWKLCSLIFASKGQPHGRAHLKSRVSGLNRLTPLLTHLLSVLLRQ